MSTSSTAAIGASTATSANSTTGTSSLGAINSEQFMLLLLAQLRNQNPLEPMEDKDLMNQITQLNSLEELQKINSGIQTLNKSNQLTEAASLIGKKVEVENDDKTTTTGLVTGVSLVKSEVMLWLGDKTVPLSSLITVKEGDDGNG
jgi:flagellar basal-body rod modification protein FlgD